MTKIVSMEDAVSRVTDGMTLMFGGFLGCGNPIGVVDALIESGVRDLVMIANDASTPDHGIGKLVKHGRVRRLIASHVGTNPEVAAQMNAGTLEVELVPQGTLAERIHAGGAGLGGFLTPTGLGTPVQDGKQVISMDGNDFLLELPLRADIAFLSGHSVDPVGNIWYRGSTRNFNAIMALAADTVIVEADNLVSLGAIEPENVVTPGVLVDYIVKAGASA